MDNSTESPDNLHSQSLSLHFLYTFLFSSFDLDGLISKKKGNWSERDLQEFVRSGLDLGRGQVNICSEGGKYYRTNQDRHLFEHYLAPFLYLKMSYLEILDEIPENIIKTNYQLFRQNAEGRIVRSDIRLESFEKRILILESGQGVEDLILRFSPEKDSILDSTDAVYLSNIGMRRRKLGKKENSEFSPFMFRRRGKEVYLFDIFFHDITLLEKVLSSTIQKAERRRGSGSTLANRDKGKTIRWIDTDPILRLVGDVAKFQSDLHFQDPFPLICITVPEGVYSEIFLDSDQREVLLHKRARPNQHKEFRPCKDSLKTLLMLLFRSKVKQFQDSSFASSLSLLRDGKLVNMCSNSSVFIHLYSRSGLVVQTPRESYLGKHASYIVPAFVETVEYLRMRWHTYIIATQWLDRILEKLSKNSTDFEQVLQMLIESRRDISRALSDPLAYRFSSGSMDRIYSTGLGTFRIPELQQIVIEKFAMIESLYSNLLEYEKVKELELLEQEIQKARGAKKDR